MFDIAFEPDDADVSPVEHATGRIIVGEFEERFEAPLDHFSRSDYENQWTDAANQILAFGNPVAFITSMVDPTNANFLHWWPAYRFGDEIRIQHQILFLDQVAGSFSMDRPYEHIPPYRRTNEEGDDRSEWGTSVSALDDFVS